MTTAASESDQRWGAHSGAAVARTLDAMIGAQRLPHALLLCGPEGVGKRDLALRIAQSQVCQPQNGAEAPCGRCRPCRRIHDSDEPRRAIQHADVQLVQPGGICGVADHNHDNSRTIGICAVRALERDAILAPFEGSARVFIIDPADALTPEAADAFLKTLEEPPPGVVFLLLSSREHLLSETVRSRCRFLRLPPLPRRRLDDWLAQRPDAPTDADQRDQLARLARGRGGWLEQALAQTQTSPNDERAAQIEQAVRLADADRAERLEWAEQIAGRRGATGRQAVADVLLVLDAWSDWWRDLWLHQCGRGGDIVHTAHRAQIAEQAARYAPEQVSRFLSRLHDTRTQIQRDANLRLAIEVMLLHLPPPRR